MKPIFEIAINQSKQSKHQTFLETRKNFVKVLQNEKATLNEGKWSPFFTIDPNIDLKSVLAGITKWRSIIEFEQTAERLILQKEAKDYFSSFNPLVYALLEPLDGEEFNLESLKESGNVVEFITSKRKTTEAFGEARELFLKSLKNTDGFKFAKKFKVYKFGGNGKPNFIEDIQSTVVVWESAEKFMAASQTILDSKPYKNYVSLVEVENYFAMHPAK